MGATRELSTVQVLERCVMIHICHRLLRTYAGYPSDW